jgi:hypothetical protein
MNQDFTAQEFKGGNTGNGTTGGTCLETSLYKATDGKIEFVELIQAGDAFPPFPGGKGTKACAWTRLTVASDGSKTGFTSVKVVAGTL